VIAKRLVRHAVIFASITTSVTMRIVVRKRAVIASTGKK